MHGYDAIHTILPEPLNVCQLLSVTLSTNDFLLCLPTLLTYPFSFVCAIQRFPAARSALTDGSHTRMTRLKYQFYCVCSFCLLLFLAYEQHSHLCHRSSPDISEALELSSPFCIQLHESFCTLHLASRVATRHLLTFELVRHVCGVETCWLLPCLRARNPEKKLGVNWTLEFVERHFCHTSTPYPPSTPSQLRITSIHLADLPSRPTPTVTASDRRQHCEECFALPPTPTPKPTPHIPYLCVPPPTIPISVTLNLPSIHPSIHQPSLPHPEARPVSPSWYQSNEKKGRQEGREGV